MGSYIIVYLYGDMNTGETNYVIIILVLVIRNNLCDINDTIY